MKNLRYSNRKISFITKNKTMVWLISKVPISKRLVMRKLQNGYTSVYIIL